MRGTELIGLPVVTLAGDDVAEVRDVVYASGSGEIMGFSLNKRGFFAGRLKQVVTVDALTAIGRDALMIGDDGALVEKGEAPQPVREATADRDVIGVSVITEDGTALGEVTDVVVSTGRQVEVVGYELGGSEVTDARDGRRLFIPLVDQVAVSGDALIVPSALADFVGDDLTGFGAAIARYRSEHGSGGGTKARTETVSASSPTKAELYAEARRRGVRGRSSMTKAQLASALSEVDV
jgi:uncharacterized protein YrrD